jgi:hypothetical protein
LLLPRSSLPPRSAVFLQMIELPCQVSNLLLLTPPPSFFLAGIGAVNAVVIRSYSIFCNSVSLLLDAYMFCGFLHRSILRPRKIWPVFY